MTDQAHRVVRALLDAGHLQPEECQDRAFSVEERPGRNSLIIIRTDARTLTVKRFGHPAGSRRHRIALQALAGQPRHFEVSSVVAVDGDRLVCSSPPGMETLHERWMRRMPRPRLAARVGRAIASLHISVIPDGWARAAPSGLIHDLDVGILESSAGAREVLRRLQASGLGDAVASVADRLEACPPAFCHGDVRSTNLLVSRDPAGLIELIDWETAGPGARWLDLGAGLAIFVELALLAGRGVPDPAVLRAYLAAYALGSGSQVDMLLTVQCAGAQLVRTAVEYSAANNGLPEVAERLLTVGSLLLRNPVEGAIRLALLA